MTRCSSPLSAASAIALLARRARWGEEPGTLRKHGEQASYSTSPINLLITVTLTVTLTLTLTLTLQYVTGVSVSVLNLRGESMASGAITATQPGLRVRLMRGTYTVRVTASGTDDELGRRLVLPEEAKLELARVPAPTADGPVELKVPG